MLATQEMRILAFTYQRLLPILGVLVGLGPFVVTRDSALDLVDYIERCWSEPKTFHMRIASNAVHT